MNIQDNLDVIKKKMSYDSKFIYSTYVWNYDKINPNSKGTDFYNLQKNQQNNILNSVLDSKVNLNKYLENEYSFKKLDGYMKQKLIDLGIWYNIDKAWHKKIKMPKDKNDNELPWFDIDGKSNKQGNNSDVMKKILDELYDNIQVDKNKYTKIKQTIIDGIHAACFCYGKINFRHINKDFHKLGITVLILGPGSIYSYTGDYLPPDNEYDVLITFRNKQTYGELTERLIKQCNKFNMNYYVEIFSVKDGNYQELINYKPKFILNTIEKFNKPVLYTDADMYPLQYLHLFDQVYYDCMVLNWNTDIETIREDITALDICYNDLVLNTSGGTMWWSNSLQSKNTLKIWDLLSNNNKTKADDRILDIVFTSTKSINNLKCFWFPNNYIYLTDKLNGQGNHLRDYMGPPLIIHPEDITSEELAVQTSNYNKKIKRQPVDYFFSKYRDPESRDWYARNIKSKCYENTDIIDKYNGNKIKQIFKYHEKDMNLIFRNLNKKNTLIEDINMQLLKGQQIHLFKYTPYDYSFDINNTKIDEILKYRFLYKKNSKFIFTLFTNNEETFNKYINHYQNILQHINNKYSLLLILYEKKCKSPILCSFIKTYQLLDNKNIKDDLIKVFPIQMDKFTKYKQLFKPDILSDSADTFNKIHTSNLEIILNDEVSEIFAVNYNSLSNTKLQCVDNNVLNIIPNSIFCMLNNVNCKYFVTKCLSEFNKIKKPNNVSEYLIIDNIFNTNTLIKYWRTQWLPEEYIIDYVYCEDYSCEIGDLNEYYDTKLDGNEDEMIKWGKLQSRLKNCYDTDTTYTSSLFISYFKEFDDFMKNPDPRLKIGEDN
tara:strand:- start:1610 stop:4087 length:2478 start_codon:yes stop_codon:yes gene_type:complete